MLGFRVIAFSISELRENQRGEGKITSTQIRVKLNSFHEKLQSSLKILD